MKNGVNTRFFSECPRVKKNPCRPDRFCGKASLDIKENRYRYLKPTNICSKNRNLQEIWGTLSISSLSHFIFPLHFIWYLFFSPGRSSLFVLVSSSRSSIFMVLVRWCSLVFGFMPHCFVWPDNLVAECRLCVYWLLLHVLCLFLRLPLWSAHKRYRFLSGYSICSSVIRSCHHFWYSHNCRVWNDFWSRLDTFLMPQKHCDRNPAQRHTAMAITASCTT